METFLIAMFLYHFTPYWSDPGAAIAPPPRRPSVLTVEVQEETGTRSVPPGAQRVPVLTLTLEAACVADIPIESITLQRRGMGNADDIAGVYALQRGVRVSNAPSIIKRDGTVRLQLRDVHVEACTQKEITIVVDFSEDASVAGEHSFVLKGTTGVQAGGTASVFIRSGATAGTVALSPLQTMRTSGSAVGTVSIEYLDLFRRPTYGSRQMVGRLRLAADSGDHHQIHAVTLTNKGSARNMDLRNLYLVVGGTVSQRTDAMDGDRVRLVFDPPLVLEKNQQKIGVLRADVHASRSRTMEFVVEEPGDVESRVVRGRR